MFSSRLPPLRPNRLAQAIRRARSERRPVVDLTTSNPTRVGLHYPEDVLAALARPPARIYDPDPRGLASARAAVAADYARRGTSVASDRIVLTAGTSEAYSMIFKLLCAPAGDTVLVPVPSYPLFDHLAALDGVEPRPYRLEYQGRWLLDELSVDVAWMDNTRGVLAVSPNNPTGSILSRAELEWLSARCAERGAALIVDEVFADYAFDDEWSFRLKAEATGMDDTGEGDNGGEGDNAGERDDGGERDASLSDSVASGFSRKSDLSRKSDFSRTRSDPPLLFRLGGLSKSAGLPQVKLGWIAVDGPAEIVGQALERLDLISDTYLSVSTPVQVAAPELIALGAGVRAQIRSRVRANYAALRTIAAEDPSVEVLHADGGWSAVMRVPSTRPEEDLAIEILEAGAVLVHPGFFFDFPHEAFLVMSLLPQPETFADGVGRVLRCVHG